MKNFIKFLLVLFVLGMVGLIIYIGTKPLTGNESLLLSVLLTIVSILATWIVSKYYSDDSINKAVEKINAENQSKLKTYAEKATEKVDSLSNELQKLSIFLQDELDQEYENHDEEMISREERLKSAIYITETLKSINDNALSDWKGVIPSELEEREELEREKNEEVSSITDRLEEVVSELQRSGEAEVINDSSESTSKQIEDLRKEISVLARSFGGPRFTKSLGRKKSIKQEVTSNCPACKSTITYKQRPQANSVKVFNCESCATEIMGKWDPDNGFHLELPEIKSETVNCPSCGTENSIDLSTKVYTANEVECKNCHIPFRATRKLHEIQLKSLEDSHHETIPAKITDDLIGQVKLVLPPQPWPIGTHRQIGDQIGVPPRMVTKIMNILIDRGEAFVQHKGKIYIEKENK